MTTRIFDVLFADERYGAPKPSSAVFRVSSIGPRPHYGAVRFAREWANCAGHSNMRLVAVEEVTDDEKEHEIV